MKKVNYLRLDVDALEALDALQRIDLQKNENSCCWPLPTKVSKSVEKDREETQDCSSYLKVVCPIN